jgi:hypothetical protein
MMWTHDDGDGESAACCRRSSRKAQPTKFSANHVGHDDDFESDFASDNYESDFASDTAHDDEVTDDGIPAEHPGSASAAMPTASHKRPLLMKNRRRLRQFREPESDGDSDSSDDDDD